MIRRRNIPILCMCFTLFFSLPFEKSRGGLFSFSQSTVLYNNGCPVYMAPASILHLNGGLQNDNLAATTGVFKNDGIMTIATIPGLQGSVFLTNNSTMQGNGTYLIEQDWVNDAIFIADSSTVNFNGNLQEFITSTNNTVTTFNNLILTGTGSGNNAKKTLQSVNAVIGTSGTLALNDRELETSTNTLFVLNPSTTCITNNTTPGSEGFVSSSFNIGSSGFLSRVCNSAAGYLFPTGSSVNGIRYRPVILTPASASSNIYTARLGYNIATTDGFDITFSDTTMYTLNPAFYHEIKRSSGNANADIEIFYNEIIDGSWDGMAKWHSSAPGNWNDMGTVNTTSSLPLNSVLKVNWADFSDSPYILSRKSDLICQDYTVPNVFTPDGNGINELFVINDNCIKDFHLQIYNRWGMKLFETTLPGHGWDGRTDSGLPSPEGTYYYILKTISLSGKESSSAGSVLLLRKN